jgi:hypothetical protein
MIKYIVQRCNTWFKEFATRRQAQQRKFAEKLLAIERSNHYFLMRECIGYKTQVMAKRLAESEAKIARLKRVIAQNAGTQKR